MSSSSPDFFFRLGDSETVHWTLCVTCVKEMETKSLYTTSALVDAPAPSQYCHYCLVDYPLPTAAAVGLTDLYAHEDFELVDDASKTKKKMVVLEQQQQQPPPAPRKVAKLNKPRKALNFDDDLRPYVTLPEGVLPPPPPRQLSGPSWKEFSVHCRREGSIVTVRDKCRRRRDYRVFSHGVCACDQAIITSDRSAPVTVSSSNKRTLKRFIEDLMDFK